MTDIHDVNRIAYRNTVFDGVRFLLDEHQAMPDTHPVAPVLKTVMHSLLAMPIEPEPALKPAFNRIVCAPYWRKHTVNLMREVANKELIDLDVISRHGRPRLHVVGQKVDPVLAEDAGLLLSTVFDRLARDEGVRAPGYSAQAERTSTIRAISFVTARQSRAKDGVVEVSRSDETLMLSDSFSQTMNWAVDQGFKLACQGENTAGRLLAAFGIPMAVSHIAHHEMALTPAARQSRELQLAFRVLTNELQSGVLRQWALDDYADRCTRLQTPLPEPTEKEVSEAMKHALREANSISGYLGELIERADRWARPRASVRELRKSASPSIA